MVIAALFAAVTLAFTAFADDTKYSHGYFYYHVHEGYVSICGYFGGEKAVEKNITTCECTTMTEGYVCSLEKE